MKNYRSSMACMGLALLPSWAQAHGTIPGIMPFYGGMAHPFLVPAHVMAVISMGLLMGRSTEASSGVRWLAMLMALALGLGFSRVAGEPDTDLLLLGATAIAALTVAAARPLPPVVQSVLVVLMALILGLGSSPDGLADSKRWAALAGIAFGVLLATVAVSLYAEMPKASWLQIATRVVSSWLAAAALLVLALTWVGPKKGTESRQDQALQHPKIQ